MYKNSFKGVAHLNKAKQEINYFWLFKFKGQFYNMRECNSPKTLFGESKKCRLNNKLMFSKIIIKSKLKKGGKA